jgi:hypothetical protein
MDHLLGIGKHRQSCLPTTETLAPGEQYTNPLIYAACVKHLTLTPRLTINAGVGSPRNVFV